MKVDRSIIENKYTTEVTFELFIPGVEPLLFKKTACFDDLRSYFLCQKHGIVDTTQIIPNTTIKVYFPKNYNWASKEEIEQYLKEINDLQLFPNVTFNEEDFTIQFTIELYCENYKYYLCLLSIIRFLFETPLADGVELFFELRKEFPNIKFLDLLFYSMCLIKGNIKGNIFNGHNIFFLDSNYEISSEKILFSDKFLKNFPEKVLTQRIQQIFFVKNLPIHIFSPNYKKQLKELNERHKEI